MTLLKNRLPSRQEILVIFALAFVIVYSWSTLMFFNYLPGWLLFLDSWTIAGIFAYSQVFAFFESLVVLAGLVLVAAVLPPRIFRDRFVAQAAAIVVLAAAAAVVLHLLREVPLWPSKRLLFGLLAYLLASALAWMGWRMSCPLLAPVPGRARARVLAPAPDSARVQAQARAQTGPAGCSRRRRCRRPSP